MLYQVPEIMLSILHVNSLFLTLYKKRNIIANLSVKRLETLDFNFIISNIYWFVVHSLMSDMFTRITLHGPRYNLMKYF